MRHICCLALLLALLSSSSCFAVQITATPTTAVASKVGTWTITLSDVGPALKAGDEFLVQFPMGWHVNHWAKAKAEQVTDPESPDYVAATCSNPAVKVHVLLRKQGLDGQVDRYGKVFRVIIDEGEIGPNDKLSLVYGGKKGTIAPDTAELNTVLARVKRRDDTAVGQMMTCTIMVRPMPPKYARFFAPSQAVVGQHFPIRLRLFDERNNIAAYDGKVRVKGSDGQTVEMKIAAGKADVLVRAMRPGVVTFKTVTAIPGGNAETNPTRLTTKAPKTLIAWGDMHSHTEISKDAEGTTEGAFLYARDGNCLDFYTCTDHTAGDNGAEGITDKEWNTIKDLNAKYNNPGHFVTILAYEWSMGAPWGHHNVFFRTASEQLYKERDTKNLEGLWQALRGKQAFTVPHHTGIGFSRGGEKGSAVDFNQYGDPLEPLIEIFSLWGSSEYYGNDMPYEQQTFGAGSPSSKPGQHYARDAWLLGRDLGVVGGGDDHTAHPGRPNAGITAVLTPSLTREAVFDSLRSRHTYTCVGERMLVDFAINGKTMGDDVTLAPKTLPLINCEVTGTANIAFAEVVRLQDGKYETVWRAEPKATRHVKFSFKDSKFHESAMYYLRVAEQKKIESRQVYAWSSPIWVAQEARRP